MSFDIVKHNVERSMAGLPPIMSEDELIPKPKPVPQSTWGSAKDFAKKALGVGGLGEADASTAIPSSNIPIPKVEKKYEPLKLQSTPAAKLEDSAPSWEAGYQKPQKAAQLSLDQPEFKAEDVAKKEAGEITAREFANEKLKETPEQYNLPVKEKLKWANRGATGDILSAVGKYAEAGYVESAANTVDTIDGLIKKNEAPEFYNRQTPWNKKIQTEPSISSKESGYLEGLSAKGKAKAEELDKEAELDLQGHPKAAPYVKAAAKGVGALPVELAKIGLVTKGIGEPIGAVAKEALAPTVARMATSGVEGAAGTASVLSKLPAFAESAAGFGGLSALEAQSKPNSSPQKVKDAFIEGAGTGAFFHLLGPSRVGQAVALAGPAAVDKYAETGKVSDVLKSPEVITRALTGIGLGGKAERRKLNDILESKLDYGAEQRAGDELRDKVLLKTYEDIQKAQHRQLLAGALPEIVEAQARQDYKNAQEAAKQLEYLYKLPTEVEGTKGKAFTTDPESASERDVAIHQGTDVPRKTLIRPKAEFQPLTKEVAPSPPVAKTMGAEPYAGTLENTVGPQASAKGYVKSILRPKKPNYPAAGGIARAPAGQGEGFPEWSKKSQKWLEENAGKQETTSLYRAPEEFTMKDDAGNTHVIKKGEEVKARTVGNKTLVHDTVDFVTTNNQLQNLKGKAIELGEVTKSKFETPQDLGVVQKGGHTPAKEKELQDLVARRDRATSQADRDMLQGSIDSIFNPVVRDTKWGIDKYPSTHLAKGQGEQNYREVLIKAPKSEELKNLEAAGFTGTNSMRANELRKNDFKSSHWDEPNVVAHTRLAEHNAGGKQIVVVKEKNAKGRSGTSSIEVDSPEQAQAVAEFKRASGYNVDIIPQGKTTLIEEVQSDWAREGRDKGFKKPTAPREEFDKIDAEINSLRPMAIETLKKNDMLGFDRMGEALVAIRENPDWERRWEVPEASDRAILNKYAETTRKWEELDKASAEGIPNHPALKNWQEHTLKHALKEAVDAGSDSLSWVTGEQTANRYDLSKQVGLISWNKESDGTYDLNILDLNQVPIKQVTTTAAEMPNVIGKDVAKKIIESNKNVGYLDEQGLKMGGEWASNLYDKQVPNILRDLTKKYGTTFKDITLENGEVVHSMTITPALREAVKTGGQPMAGGIARRVPEKPSLEKEAGKLMYHGTLEGKDFGDFKFSEDNIGVHFTPRKIQAETRIGHKNKELGATEKGSMLERYIDIKKPLRMPDVVNWDVEGMNYGLLKTGKFTQAELAGKNLADLKQLILSKGYDGISYPNRFEGRGTSYIILEPEQIKPKNQQLAGGVARKPNEEVSMMSEWKNRAVDEAKLGKMNPDVIASLASQMEGLERTLRSREDLLDPKMLEYKSAKTSIEKNMDYNWSFEIKLECVKRLGYGVNLKIAEKKLGRSLTSDELYHLADIMKEKGLVSPCTYCYVEGWRRALADGYGAFEVKRNDAFKLLDETNGKASIEDVMKVTLFNNKKRAEALINEWNVAKETGTKPYNFTTKLMAVEEFRDAEFRKDPRALQIYDEAKNYSQGRATAAKGYKEYSPYLPGEMFDLAKKHPQDWQEVMDRAGFRFQSSSDYQVQHVIDYMQALTDLSIIKAKAHAFTKVPWFVKIFAPSKIKINMSVALKGGENGDVSTVTEDAVDGMPHKYAKQFVKDFDNVGAIAVTTNDAQMEWAGKQPWIHMVIPWHRSGMSKAQATARGYIDYTSRQHEKWLDPSAHEKESAPSAVYSDHLNNKQKYLEWCTEKGVEPRFKEFLNKPYYMKLIVDTVRPEKPQSPIEPTFDFKAAELSIKEWQKQGGDKSLYEADKSVVTQLIKDIQSGKNLLPNNVVAIKAKDMMVGDRFVDPKTGEVIVNMGKNARGNIQLQDGKRFTVKPDETLLTRGGLNAQETLKGGGNIHDRTWKQLEDQPQALTRDAKERLREQIMSKIRTPLSEEKKAYILRGEGTGETKQELLKEGIITPSGERTPKGEVVAGTLNVPLPVNTHSGEFKPSRIYERMKEDFPSLTGELDYEVTHIKDASGEAVELMSTDPDAAYRRAMGVDKSEPYQKAITNIVMSERARKEGNMELFTQLVKRRSIMGTKYGKAISMEQASVNDHSLTSYVQELVRGRMAVAGKKLAPLGIDIKDVGRTTRASTAAKIEKVSNYIDRQATDIQKKMKVSPLMADAQAWIDKITCK